MSIPQPSNEELLKKHNEIEQYNTDLERARYAGRLHCDGQIAINRGQLEKASLLLENATNCYKSIDEDRCLGERFLRQISLCYKDRARALLEPPWPSKEANTEAMRLLDQAESFQQKAIEAKQEESASFFLNREIHDLRSKREWIIEEKAKEARAKLLAADVKGDLPAEVYCGEMPDDFAELVCERMREEWRGGERKISQAKKTVTIFTIEYKGENTI